MSLPPVEVRDPHDPRLADYRSLKERHLNAEGGRFVAESERVVRRLVGSGLTVHSVLLTPPRLATLADALAGPYPVFVAAQALLDEIAGFHVHRGCLAIGERPAPAALPPGARAVVALEDLTDVDNLGALARHAAAFGADALLLSPRCADPFYRKSFRTQDFAIAAYVRVAGPDAFTLEKPDLVGHGLPTFSDAERTALIAQIAK